MALKDIVDVQIVRLTAALTRVGFGTLAFVYDTETAPISGARVLEFGDAEEVAESDDLTTTAKAALSAAFSGDLRPTRVKAIYRLVEQVDPADNENYAEVLSAADSYDPDWYAVTIESRDAVNILSVAEWVEARDKIFIAASSDAGILDPAEDEDIGSELASLSYARTGLIYSADAGSAWPDTAWAGPILPYDPGSVTWAFKRVAGVAGEAFSASAITALENKRVTRVETIQGLTRTIGGYTADAGAYFDIIRGLDWLKQRLAEDIFMRLVNSPKIPYTNTGIAMVESVVRARLQNAVGLNVIADDENLTVTVPDVADTDPTDRANRLLRDVRFTARLAGAIHKVIVRGVAIV
jgi:hypothetical protein